MPDSSVAQVASGSPCGISASQFDQSDTSNSGERREKRKRILESSEDEDPSLKRQCKYCGKIFAKSQALGGHMNCHAKERYAERVQRARELVERKGGLLKPLEQEDQRRPNFPQIPDFPLANIICSTPSVPPHITGMQTHQQGNLHYNASPLNWNPTASQNTPYVSNPDINNSDYVKPEHWTSPVLESRPPYATTFNMPYPSSQCRNQNTTPGMSYERNPAQREQFLPSDRVSASEVWPSLGEGDMQRSYLQRQAEGSISAVVDRGFNPSFQSSSSYPRQLGVAGSEFSGQGSEAFQQFCLPSSTPAAFQVHSGSMPADFSNASGTSLDVPSLPWLHPGPISAPTTGPIPDEQDFGQALVSDTMALEGRTTGPSPISQGTELGKLTVEGESAQSRQISRNNYIHGADSYSLSDLINYVPEAEMKTKHNQGRPKDP